MTRLSFGPLLLAALLAAPLTAQADSYTIQTNVIMSGIVTDADFDQVNLFNFVDPFQAPNTSLMLQPGAFQEGLNPSFVYDPITNAPIPVGPYTPSSGSFATVEDITLTHYSSAFQVLGTNDRVVSLIGSVQANPDGSRMLLFPTDNVSFGNGVSLIIFGFPQFFPANDVLTPLNVNAFLQVLPTVGSPGPAPATPEPSSLILLGTGISSLLAAAARQRLARSRPRSMAQPATAEVPRGFAL